VLKKKKMPSFRNFFSIGKKSEQQSSDSVDASPNQDHSINNNNNPRQSTATTNLSHSQDGFQSLILAHVIEGSNRNNNKPPTTTTTVNNDSITSNEDIMRYGSDPANLVNQKSGSLSGWVDVSREIQIMPWPVCCKFLEGTCEFMDKPSCCPHLHENPLNSTRPCQHGEKCPKKHFKRGWEPDNSTDRCRNCLKEFTVFNRRSHCRECGKLFCSSNKEKKCVSEIAQIGKICATCEFKMKIAQAAKGGNAYTVVKTLGKGHNSAELLAKYTDHSPEEIEKLRSGTGSEVETEAEKEKRRRQKLLEAADKEQHDDEEQDDRAGKHLDFVNYQEHKPDVSIDYERNINSNNNDSQHNTVYAIDADATFDDDNMDPSSNDNFSTNNNAAYSPYQQQQQEQEQEERDQEREAKQKQIDKNNDDDDDDDQDQQILEDTDEQIILLKQQLGNEITEYGYDDNTREEFVELLLQLSDRYEQLLVFNDTHRLPANHDQIQLFYRQQRNEILSRLLNIRETVFGKDHAGVAQILIMMGEAKRHDGELEESVKILSQALEICEQEYGHDHPETANVLSHLGVTCHCAATTTSDDDAEFWQEEKEKYLRRSIEIYEQCGEHDAAQELQNVWGL
jgi:hypothetical protein